MNPDAGSMSEFPESFEPLDLPEVPDVPRRGGAHGDPAIRPSHSPTWEAPDRAQSPNTDARAEAPPQGPRPQGSSRPDRGVGDRVNAEPPPSRGTPSLAADPVKPAPFRPELSETSPSSRVPVHMADESFLRELEATALGELGGGGSAGGR
jgi:hypothetical protein